MAYNGGDNYTQKWPYNERIIAYYTKKSEPQCLSQNARAKIAADKAVWTNITFERDNLVLKNPVNFLYADPKAYTLWCTDAVLLRVRGLPEIPDTTLRAVNGLNGSEGVSADQDCNGGHDSPGQ